MGKKFLLVAFIIAGTVFSVHAADNAKVKKTPEVTEKTPDTRIKAEGERSFWSQLGRDILLYIPNRIIDITDLFSIRADAGAPIALKVKVTDMFQLGGTSSSTYFIEKGYNRQCGAGYMDGSTFGLICFDYLDTTISEGTGTVENFTLSKEFGMVDPSLSAYKDNYTDFYEIGVDVDFVLGLGIKIHLRELPDMLAGIFFFDPTGDDLK